MVIKNKKKFIFFASLFFISIGFLFLFTKSALAWDPIESAASVAGWLIAQIVQVLGKVLILVIGLLIDVAQYNNFITSSAVSKGWIIIRDVCNMFFIAAILLIAFSTVLGSQRYSYKQTLGKLLVAAVLVNFSKFICGFFIDITQVLMLTFVNAFKDAAAGNFLQMLGMHKWLNLAGAHSGGYAAFTGTLFALILVIISLVVISIMMVILAFRIIIIWLLVVLSPLAFILDVFPGKMKSYSSMWWEKFTNQLIVGPIMAFFIWLSFSVASTSSIVNEETSDYSNSDVDGSTASVGEDNNLSEAASPSNFAKFVVSITMLVGSLMIAQQLGVAGGKLAGQAVGKMQSYATGKAGILKKVKTKATGVAKGVAGAGGRVIGGTAGLARNFAGKNIGKVVSSVGNKIDPKGNVKNLTQKGSAWVKARSDASKNRLAQGKGNILDHAVNDAAQGYAAHGNKERSAGQVEQIKRVEDAKKRMAGKSKKQLTVMNMTGTVVERQASGVMMAESGQLKGKGPENKRIIENTQRAMKWNKPMGNSFNNHIKKNSNAGLVVDTQYNGLENDADVKKLLNDIKEGKVDAGRMVQGSDIGDLDKLNKGFTKIGENFGETVMRSLDGKQLEGLRSTIGEERTDKLYEGYDPNDPKNRNDTERKKYVQATGRVDKLDNMDQFIEKNKSLVRDNISSESFSSSDVVENLMKHFGDKDIGAMTSDSKDKTAILNSVKELMRTYNTRGEIDTPNAKMARETYVKLNKGKDMGATYAGTEGTGTENERKKKEIQSKIGKNISDNDIKPKDLESLDVEALTDNPEIGRAILKKDFGKVKEYISGMTDAVQKALGEELNKMEQNIGSKYSVEEVQHATVLLDSFGNIGSKMSPQARKERIEKERQ